MCASLNIEGGNCGFQISDMAFPSKIPLPKIKPLRAWGSGSISLLEEITDIILLGYYLH